MSGYMIEVLMALISLTGNLMMENFWRLGTSITLIHPHPPLPIQKIT